MTWTARGRGGNRRCRRRAWSPAVSDRAPSHATRLSVLIPSEVLRTTNRRRPAFPRTPPFPARRATAERPPPPRPGASHTATPAAPGPLITLFKTVLALLRRLGRPAAATAASVGPVQSGSALFASPFTASLRGPDPAPPVALTPRSGPPPLAPRPSTAPGACRSAAEGLRGRARPVGSTQRYIRGATGTRGGGNLGVSTNSLRLYARRKVG